MLYDKCSATDKKQKQARNSIWIHVALYFHPSPVFPEDDQHLLIGSSLLKKKKMKVSVFSCY